jgi:gamma-glutamyltranspeptidase/glutathione hydrolase
MGMTHANANRLGRSCRAVFLHRATWLTAIVALGSVGIGAAQARSHPPLRTKKGVVAADNADAARVGAHVLADGGNAADAAAATALASGVVQPASSGIGGGGFALVYIADENKVYVIDFREVGPTAVTPEAFVRNGDIDTSLSRVGGLAVAVPGEVAGLETIVERFGKRSFRSAVAPALALARKGFTVRRFFYEQATAWKETEWEPAWFGDWLRALSEGERAVRPRLARTLAAIGKRGSKGFYRGWVARDIVAAVEARGGVMTLDDLAGYTVEEREPLWGTWRGKKIATMPLPSSGGVIVLATLTMLEQTGFDYADMGAGSSLYLHVLAEVLKHAFADRARLLGDVGHSKVSAADFLAPKRLAAMAKRVSRWYVGEHAEYGDRDLGKAGAVPNDGGTSHICVIDADGNAVALTTTINLEFGARVVGDKSGVVLNNEIDDFALRAGAVNAFGLAQSDANLVGPGKRPLSSMTPTLVFEDDRVVACLGGSGGPRIISNVVQVLLNVYIHGMDAREAVEAPRIHHQWRPDKLLVEAGISRDVVTLLRARGQTVADFTTTSSVQTVIVRDDGTREAASDPRKMGAPAAEDQLPSP